MLVLALAWSGAALAQQSASYTMSEHVFNNGGRPVGGAVAGSASHRITLDALGDTFGPGLLAGNTHQIGGGFATAYLPPGEVQGVRFSDKVTLLWNPEPSTGAYNLYRGTLPSLSGLAYGGCRAAEVANATTTDPDPAVQGEGFFYLVTAENLLEEEGIKGYRSSGALRGNAAPCP